MNLPAEPERPALKWRRPNPHNPLLESERSSDKWSATLIVVVLFGLLGFLVWKYWPERQGAMVWAVLPIDARQGLGRQSPSVVSCVQTLHEVLEADGATSPNRLLDWSSLEISQAGAIQGRISQELSKTNLRDEDTLVLYVAGRGFTLAGEARILFSDAVVGDIGQGSFAVADLLAEFQGCPARTKLLILDIASPGFDPRLGVLFNEFTYCAAQAIAAADPEVWVLLSQREFEVAGEYASQRPTLLSALVAGALSGQADLSHRGYLELRDLYRFIATQCQTRFADHPADGQRPALMKTGQLGPVSAAQIQEGHKLAILPTAVEQEGEKTPADNAATRKVKSKLKSGVNRVKSQLKSKLRQGTRLPQIAGRFVVQQPDSAGAGAGDAETAPAKTDTPPAKKTSGEPSKQSAENTPASPETPPPPETAPPQTAPDSQPAAQQTETESAEAGKDDEEIDPESNMQAVLVAMWTTWDELQDPEREFWAPIDVCPLAWRRFQWELLQHARQWRLGDDPAAVADKAQAITQDLRSLRAYLETPSGPPKFSSELATFLDPVAGAYLQVKPPGVAAFSDESYRQRDAAIRVYNEALFFLPDYARWHGGTSLGQELGAVSPFDQIAGKLTAVGVDLSALQVALAQLDGQLLERPADLQRLTDNLRKKSLANLRSELQQDVERAIGWTDLAGEKRMASLLDSPLLSAPQREALLTQWLARREPPQVSVLTSDADTPAAHDAAVPTAEWNRVSQLVKIQLATIARFDQAVAEDLTELSNKAASADGDAAKREAYRAVGLALRQFYAALPERIAAGWKQPVAAAPTTAAAPAAALRRQLQGLIRLVDARDIGRTTSSEQYAVCDEFNIRVKTRQPELELISQQLQLVLDRDAPRQIDIPFRAVAIAQGVAAAIRCELPNTVEITRRDGERTVVCEEGIPFATAVDLSTGENHQLSLFLRALRESASETEEPVQVTVTLSAQDATGLQSAECRVLCQMPQRDRVELIVRKKSSNSPEPFQGDDMIRLRSFPNRATSYELYLTNQADREKPVSVQLFQLPAVPNPTWAPGRLRSHDNQLAREVLQAVFVDGNPQRGLREDFAKTCLLAQTEMTIQSGNRETPLVFTTGENAGEQAKPSEGDGTPTVEKAGEKEVSYGLLCWIMDKNSPDRSWAKWIELPVLHPREYLSVLTPSFRNGQITVDAELNKSAGFSWNEKDPVRVTWTGVASIDLSDKIPKGSLKRGDLVADGQSERIYLAVDGYPRAVVLDVPRQPAEEAVVPAAWEDRFTAIRMERVSAQFPQSDEPAAGRPPDDVRVINGLDETIAFRPCEKLLIDLAADVPTRTFAADYDPSQAIRLTVDGQPKAGPFFADRDAKTFLVDLGETLTLRTEVHDYLVTLLPGGQDTSIEVEATLPRQEAATAPARLTIQVDGRAPHVTSDRRSYVVDLEQPLVLQLNLDDTLSGIDRVLYGIVADPNAVDEAKLETQKLTNHPKREQVSARILTAGAKLEPGKRYSVAVVAYDGAGNKAQDTLELRVQSPPPPRPVGDIVGTISYGGRALESGWSLQIVGPGYSKPVKHGVKTNEAGFQAKSRQLSEFWFRDLSPGTYTITVEGYPTGKTVKSKPIQVIVEQGKVSSAVPITEFQ